MATIAGPFNGLPPAGASSAAYNIAAAGPIKATPGRLYTLVCIAAGTITLNDSATTGAAAAANEIFPAALAMTAGQVINLNGWPCGVGITASVVTGTFALAFS